MELWYPLAQRAPLANSGGYIGGPYRGVIHSTEGSTYAGALAAYKESGNAPQFTASYEDGRFRIWQHIPLDRAGSALKHPAGTVDTNRLSAVQVEVVGFAAHADLWPTGLLDGLRVWMEWVEAQTGIKPQAPAFKPYPASYGATNGVRMTAAAWKAFNGWCSHMHVPNNLHGDCGAVDINYLLQRQPKEVPTMYEPPIGISGLVVATLKAPGGGVWMLTDIGAVYAWECEDHGAPNRHPEYWAPDQRAARLEANGDGYDVIDTKGARYGYP